jgi:hypothetical protein
MAKAVLLFNGIGFSFPLIDRAFGWAKQSDRSLVALFLKSKSETPEGYIFPSDLDAAENLSSKEDAGAANNLIINSNIRMLENRAESEDIDLASSLLSDPSEADLLQQFSGCELIFIDEKIDQAGIFTVESIDLKKFLKNTSLTTEIVRG